MFRSRIHFLASQYNEIYGIVMNARLTVHSIKDPQIREIYVAELAPLEMDLRIAKEDLIMALDVFFEKHTSPVDLEFWKMRKALVKNVRS